MSIVIQNQPFDHGTAITLSDVVDNLYGVRFVQNTGTAGVVVIRQVGTYGDLTIYLLTGQTFDVGKSWLGAKATGAGAGVSLIGLTQVPLGVPGVPGLGMGGDVTPLITPHASASINLLAWSETFSNPVWSINDLTLFPGAGDKPPGVAGYRAVSDHAFDTATTAAIRQVSGVVATNTNGASLSVLDVPTAWARYSVTFTFSGGAYVFSTYLKADDAGVGLRLKIDAVGGFIRCSYQDIGDVGEYYPWGAQLEPGSTPTAYQSRQA